MEENRGDDSYTNHCKAIDFDRTKVYNQLVSRVNDIEFFLNVIEEDGEIVGGMCAYTAAPFYSFRKVAYDQLVYVKPTYRSAKAVIRLIQSYIRWAERRDVVECRLCSSTGYKQESFTKLCQRLGFTQFEVGFSRRF